MTELEQKIVKDAKAETDDVPKVVGGAGGVSPLPKTNRRKIDGVSIDCSQGHQRDRSLLSENCRALLAPRLAASLQASMAASASRT